MALVSKTFSQIITFTRASTATYFDATGTLQSAAIDAPRFDYDPATLAARGILIEEQRTNSNLYSQDFGATGWTTNNVANVTITAAAATSPDGTTNAGSLACASTTTAQRRMYTAANITVTASTTYTTSFYVKANTWQWVNLAFTASTGLAEGFTAAFDILNGVKGTTTQSLGTGVYISHSIENAGNGWFRISVTGTTGSTLTYRPKIELLDADATAGTGCVGVIGNGVYVFGAQTEVGDFPTSYIPTTTTSLTRSADLALVNTVSPWFNAAEGTLFAEAEWPVIAPAATGVRLGAALSDGSVSDRVLIGRGGGADNARFTVTSASINQNGTNGQQIASVFTSSNTAKLAYAYATDNMSAAANGVTAAATPPNALPIGINLLSIGNRFDTNAGTSINGWVRRVTYYPRRMSDAELASITA